MTGRQRRRAAAAVAMGLLLPSCIIPLAGDRTGRSVSLHPADLQPGKTSKVGLFGRLGPPLAIAGPGEEVAFPAPRVQHVARFGARLDGGGTTTRQADAWFASFEARGPVRAGHRVYYWSTTTHGGWALWLVFLVFRGNSSSTDELWVLVDEETGLVADVVRRSGG